MNCFGTTRLAGVVLVLETNWGPFIWKGWALGEIGQRIENEGCDGELTDAEGGLWGKLGRRRGRSGEINDIGLHGVVVVVGEVDEERHYWIYDTAA